jgi:subtilase family serine protease
LATGLILLIALVLGVSAPASAASGSQRVGSKPPIPAGAQRIGSLPGTTSVQAVVTLQPRKPQALASYAEQVSTPGSSAYHHYLTVSQFVDRFGPNSAQVRKVAAALRGEGLNPGTVTANHLSLAVTAPASRLGSAFSTSFSRYRLAGGRLAYANTSAPAVPLGVAGIVHGVIGLSNLAVHHPLSTRHATPGGASDTSATSSNATAAVTSAAPCLAAKNDAATNDSFTADQIASAYGLDSLYNASNFGNGVTVALYELEPYSSSDIGAYQTCYGTSASVTSTSVDGGPAKCTGFTINSESCGLEADLDIEDVAGLAPGAGVHVYQGPNTDAGAYDTYNRMVADNTAQVISTSWGLCESQEGSSAASAENTLFQEAAVQGQSLFAAAGDNGTADCTDNNGNPVAQRAVDDPASQPFVTGVGGTSMTSAGPPPIESVWNDGAAGGAGGGGVSALWSQPSYQSGFTRTSAMTCGGSNTTCREVPDVSASAGEHRSYEVYYDGGWTAVWGTSAAAPTWASLVGLIDSSASCTQVGFANPALYRAASANYSATFNDILSGNNNFDGVTGYSAASGYDLASGLGSPKGAGLASALCGQPWVVFSGNPGTESSTLGVQAASVTLRATSSHGSAITYGAAGLPPGLSINSSSGTISGTPTATGSYSVTATATDAQGTTSTIGFSWNVSPVTSSSSTSTSTSTSTTTSGSPPPAATVSVSPIGSQSGHVSKAVGLLVSASDSRGLPLHYSATGLPGGLAINTASGLISGTPTRAGVYGVTVTARDTSGNSGSTVFRWTIAGRPSVAKHALRLNAARPQLVLRLKAGSYAPAIRSITLRSRSSALRLSAKLRALRSAIVATAGGRLKLANQARKGSLTVAVVRGRGAAPITLTISTPELGVSSSVLSKLLAHRRTGARLTLVVKDITGFQTKLGVRL